MSAPMTTMIDITNAEKTFIMHLQGGIELPVVRGVSFHVEPGECVVLSGPSGAGKSSILKMIFGNYRCDGGRIGIRHQGTVIDLATAEPRQVLSVRRSTIGYVSQFLRAVPRVATIDVVAEPLIANGSARAEARDKAAQLTVRFVSQMISVTRDKAGTIVDGNPDKVADITDVWTFARDTSSRDPNWKLVGTGSAS